MFLWQHEPVVLPVSSLLPILNDHLLEYPVFIQTFGETDLEIIDVPFPLEPVPENEYDKNQLEKLPILHKIQSVLNLSSAFGFIKLLKITPESEWIPLELHFGLPLGDMKLNADVCKKIEKFNLFSQENLTRFSRQTREFSLRLLDFISRFQIGEFELDNENVPLPGKDVIFYDGRIQRT